MANRVATVAPSESQLPKEVGLQAAAAGRVLGIDPGLDRTGYAVLDHLAEKVIEAGVIRTTLGRPLAERLREIETALEEVVTDHHIRVIAVENLYAHYKHPNTAILMGHARGVILLTAARHGLDVIGLAATQIKKTITGNGRASKIQIQRAITAALKLREIPEPADVADALAIAVCAGMMLERRV